MSKGLACLLLAFIFAIAGLQGWVEYNRAAWQGEPLGAGRWFNVALAFLVAAGIASVIGAVKSPWPHE